MRESRYMAISYKDCDTAPSILYQDEEGDTPLHISLINKRPDLALLLITACSPRLIQAVVNVSNRAGQRPLHLAVLQDMPEIVRALVVRGAQITLRDRKGNTALHLACARASYACALALTTPLKPEEVAGAKVPFFAIPQSGTILNYEGLSCLHLASEHPSYDIMEHLTKRCGHDVNMPDGLSGETILHKVVCRKDIISVQYLLFNYEHELQVNAHRFDGCTAYTIARGINSEDICNLLVMHGAHAQDLDSYNSDAYHSLPADTEMSSGYVCDDEKLSLPEDLFDNASPCLYDDVRISGKKITGGVDDLINKILLL